MLQQPSQTLFKAAYLRSIDTDTDKNAVAETDPNTLPIMTILGMYQPMVFLILDIASATSIPAGESPKLIMVKKEVSIQMVVASRAFGLTLLEPPIFSTRNDTDIQEKEQKESQRQTNPSTEWKGQSQNYRECMRTRSKARRLQQQQQQVSQHLVETPKDTMADNRTMAELLQAPTEGYEDAIVVPEIEAANFEIKHGLLTLVQNKQFFATMNKEDPMTTSVTSLKSPRFRDILMYRLHQLS
ncbi:hypothetical protein Tco_0763617 [Tanacetum coccineum]